MIEIFTTDIRTQDQAKRIMPVLGSQFPGLKINFDLAESDVPYPCGHSILRVEGTAFQAEQIISALDQSGFKCAILEDKICEKKTPGKPEFWETAFLEKQEMWGFEPAHSAVLVRDFFVEKSIKNVLIPGIGYGRNAQTFRDAGMNVTGIEISKTAIELAKKHYGPGMTIYHGSVTDMPFVQAHYDGIFCYALIHLLDESGRAKLIQDCYEQLSEGGYMVFIAISKAAPTYGQGTMVGKDRYEMFGGVRLFFYDRESIEAEFGGFGLFEVAEVQENYPFFLVKCQKGG